LPIAEGKLVLGAWQQILDLECLPISPFSHV